MPLTIVDGGVVAITEVNVLEIREERHLNSVGMSLNHGSSIIRDMTRGNAVEREKYAVVVLLRELHPHRYGEAGFCAGEKRNHLRCRTASGIAKVEIVVHGYGYEGVDRLEGCFVCDPLTYFSCSLLRLS